jgi:hypothetical protein
MCVHSGRGISNPGHTHIRRGTMPPRGRNKRVVFVEAAGEAPPRHAMRATWRDPDDITPGARRTPKEISGWRRYDPLRKMLVHPNSGITVDHIMAADKLRELVDVATLGFSVDRSLVFITQAYLPRAGMGPGAIAQVQAMRAVARVIILFPGRQLAVIQAVILRNQTISACAQARGEARAAIKRRLLAILERLVQHFQGEIEDEIAKGHRQVI